MVVVVVKRRVVERPADGRRRVAGGDADERNPRVDRRERLRVEVTVDVRTRRYSIS